MMRSPLAFFLAFVALFAGNVLAELNITIGNTNLTAAAFLGTNDSVRTGDTCNSACTGAQSAISNCNGNNTCLCVDATKPILDCEQCMFNQLIALNRRPADSLAGQTSSLAAYTAACNGTTGTPLQLALPSDWDGPFGQGLTIGTTVIAVGSAFIIGLFSISIVNSM